jgi:tRNA dimethylallyltransferase
MQKKLPKIIVVLGPTASGKSDLAVHFAKKYNGEVVSADSRQVYKNLNIGTGKITKKEMHGIPHHLLDIVSPKKTFTVADYQQKAERAIADILKRNKLPIICGGTGFYIQAIVDNIALPEVPPNPTLRKKLENKTDKELFLMLAALDLRRAATIDLKNPRRLVRAIEVATYLGKVPELLKNPKYECLQIGIQTEDEILKIKIKKRLEQRIEAGMIEEAKKLHKEGVSWKRMESLGLEYRYLARYIQKKITKKELLAQLQTEIWKYAKRQKTWFKKDTRIHWHFVSSIKKIQKDIESFI